MNIRCPLCDWTYSLPDLPPVNESTLAGVFGPGVMLNQALNNRMFKTEEELRNHFGTHKLADWAAKAVQAWILEFQEKARERC